MPSLYVWLLYYNGELRYYRIGEIVHHPTLSVIRLLQVCLLSVVGNVASTEIDFFNCPAPIPTIWFRRHSVSVTQK